MKTVSFTEMKNGTEADYKFLAEHEAEFAKELPARLWTASKALGILYLVIK